MAFEHHGRKPYEFIWVLMLLNQFPLPELQELQDAPRRPKSPERSEARSRNICLDVFLVGGTGGG